VLRSCLRAVIDPASQLRAATNKQRQGLHKKYMPWVFHIFAVYCAFLSMVVFVGMVRGKVVTVWLRSRHTPCFLLAFPVHLQFHGSHGQSRYHHPGTALPCHHLPFTH
jgi:hypothetical protein